MMMIGVWFSYYDKGIVVCASVISNLLVFLFPFVYGCYMTWKLYDLSELEKETWDLVDVGFIENLRLGKNIMIVTGVFELIWGLVGCILQIMRS